MKKINFIAALFLSIFLLACQNNNNQSQQSNTDESMNNSQNKVDKDIDFLNKAKQGSMMEIQLGKLAEQKGQSAAVRNFGRMMVTDHSKADSSLNSLAQQNNIMLDQNLNEDKQEDINDLAKLSGKEFDKKYVNMMVDDHQEDVDNFKDEVDDASSPQVKQWASSTLPVLEKHLSKIKEIKQNMNL